MLSQLTVKSKIGIYIGFIISSLLMARGYNSLLLETNVNTPLIDTSESVDTV